MPPRVSKGRFTFNPDVGQGGPTDGQYTPPAPLPTSSRMPQQIKEVYLRVDLIDFDPENPRTGELPEIERMVASIGRKGLVQAIAVVRDGDRFTCKVGNRRLAAYKWLAGEEPGRYAQIRATVLTDGDGTEEAILSNTQIVALSLADRGRAFGRLHDMGYSDSDIGELFNLSRETVNVNRNRVVELEQGQSLYDVSHRGGSRSDEGGRSQRRTQPASDPYRPLSSAINFASRKLAERGRLSPDERNAVKVKAQEVRKAMDELIKML